MSMAGRRMSHWRRPRLRNLHPLRQSCRRGPRHRYHQRSPRSQRPAANGRSVAARRRDCSRRRRCQLRRRQRSRLPSRQPSQQPIQPDCARLRKAGRWAQSQQPSHAAHLKVRARRRGRSTLASSRAADQTGRQARRPDGQRRSSPMTAGLPRQRHLSRRVRKLSHRRPHCRTSREIARWRWMRGSLACTRACANG